MEEAVIVKFCPVSTARVVDWKEVKTSAGFTVTERLLVTVKPLESVTLTVTE